MSLEGHLEKGLFCHCWLNAGKPGIELVGLLLPMFAKVCKIFQLPTLEFLTPPLMPQQTGYTIPIVPIPKVPIPKEIGDLRPIALTPLPGKLLERFVHTQIMAHLDNNFLLNDIQNGFRKKHSTTDTIFKFTTELQHNKNNKLNTIAFYIDFKKAFDTVNHNILLEKLKLLKIGKKVLLWVKTYLSDRTQVTQIQNVCSSREVVATGVPQGLILGPML